MGTELGLNQGTPVREVCRCAWLWGWCAAPVVPQQSLAASWWRQQGRELLGEGAAWGRAILHLASEGSRERKQGLRGRGHELARVCAQALVVLEVDGTWPGLSVQRVRSCRGH